MTRMDVPLTTEATLLLALRQGPGYGLELVRRVKTATGGRVRLAAGSVHRALRRLQRSGRARRWTVVPGRQRGARARVYYELTPRGLARAESDVATLRALASPSVEQPTVAEVAAMRGRLREAADASAFVSRLQRLRSAQRGRP